MFKGADETRKNKIWRIVTILYAILLCFIHFIRIFDRNFWGDEAFTINIVNTSFSDMIQITAADVHPPLYYIIVRLFCSVFGYEGPIYHLVSFVPYVFLLVLGLTVVWKWFGKESTVLLISFAAFLTEAIKMNVEVRMYTWSVLFIFIAYLSLYHILTTKKIIGWTIFVMASLAAAYTHYYCLISVAFFYLIIILDSLFRRKEMIKRMFIMCIITILCYIPWLIIIFRTFRDSIDNFWQTYVIELWPCFEYVFLSKYSVVLFAGFVIGVILWFVKELRCVTNPQKKHTGITITDKSIWVFAGVFSIVGTILVGIVLSIMIRPMFIPRYLFPISVTAWVLFGVCISAFKNRTVYMLIVLSLVWGSGIPEYYNTYISEKQSSEQLEKTLALTVPEIQEDDIIITDTIHIIWTISELYYPEVTCESIHSLFSLLDRNKTFWCVLSEGLNEDMITELEEKGFYVENIIENGVLGTHQVSVYRINAI